MFTLQLILAGIVPAPEPDLSRFSVPLQCLKHSERNLQQEYQTLIDEQKREPAYWVGRDRDLRQAYTSQLEQAQYAWQCLEYLSAQPSKYWANELRLTIGDDAFRAGVMPAFPGVYVLTEH